MEIVKERNQFQSFMENAPLLAWITDADGVLHYMNSRFKNSFKYTDEHLNKKIGSIDRLPKEKKHFFLHAGCTYKNKSIELFHEWIDENNKSSLLQNF